VLSAVGLLPLAFSGTDIDALLEGARELQNEITPLRAEDNPAWHLAACHYLLHMQGGITQTVHYVYGDPLLLLGAWFRQLWAESLGKALRTDGSVGALCQTPAVSRGAADQHSQNQLYLEGPGDKLYGFITSRQWATDYSASLPAPLALDSEAQLAECTFGEILRASYEGTRDALIEAGRPVYEVVLPRVGPVELGAYLQLWMLATAYAAHLYGVNPFDQPGVERSKTLTLDKLAQRQS
jgi:glucose-6-phosphate isomerase